MKDNDLITRLREHAEWAKANEWETPIMLGNDLDAAVRIICCQESEIQAFRNSSNGYKALSREWISVKDKIPKKFEPVIVCRENGKVEQGYKDVGDWWKVYGTRTKRITHWMPLPEPPEEVMR